MSKRLCQSRNLVMMYIENMERKYLADVGGVFSFSVLGVGVGVGVFRGVGVRSSWGSTVGVFGGSGVCLGDVLDSGVRSRIGSRVERGVSSLCGASCFGVWFTLSGVVGTGWKLFLLFGVGDFLFLGRGLKGFGC